MFANRDHIPAELSGVLWVVVGDTVPPGTARNNRKTIQLLRKCFSVNKNKK